MLNRITFDNDTATLDVLIGYFKRLDQTLAEVYQALDKYVYVPVSDEFRKIELYILLLRDFLAG